MMVALFSRWQMADGGWQMADGGWQMAVFIGRLLLAATSRQLLPFDVFEPLMKFQF
jgi:hypothetical protein